MIFNNPIKDAREWHTFKHWDVPIRKDRWFAIRSYLHTLKNTPFHHYWKRTEHVLFGLVNGVMPRRAAVV